MATKVHPVVLEDLEAWHEQMHDEMNAQCFYEVYDPPISWGVRPAVKLTVKVLKIGREAHDLWEGYEIISRTETGAIESAMLRLVSKALLELQREVERVQRSGLFA